MPSNQSIIQVNPRDLLPSRRNVRSDPGDLAGLAETIREHGILQPIGVQRDGQDYRIVFGNRRRDAAIVVGLERVPCLLIDNIREDQVIIQQALENLQRLDLNDMDKCRAFDQMATALVAQGFTQTTALESMARTLGLSGRQIQRYLRLNQLAPRIQQMVAQGDLGVTHAQHLIGIQPETRQEDLALLVMDESLSAAELARLVAALERNPNIEPRTALETLRRGERVPVIETRARESLPHMGPAPTPQESDSGPWDDDTAEKPQETEGYREQVSQQNQTGVQPDAGFGDSPFAFEPSTKDGNRVRRIHSLDALGDEVQRIAQCVQDGDLQRFLGADEKSALKLRLIARQLRFVTDAVSSISQALDAAK